LFVQNRYVGDIGDFGKYALLNSLTGGGLRLGVHWYLNADEEQNSDGRFTDYPQLRHCDERLYGALQELIETDQRSVAAVQKADILPRNTVYFSSPLSSRENWGRAERRAAWNAQALQALTGAELIFMDPDNGLTRQPASLLGATAAKYVSATEIVPYYLRGQSLLIYHHQNREKGGLVTAIPERFALLRSLGCETVWAFVFRRVSVRIYFVIAAPGHVDTLAKRTLDFLETPWCREGHFELFMPAQESAASQ
jgi:hypothetical protein